MILSRISVFHTACFAAVFFFPNKGFCLKTLTAYHPPSHLVIEEIYDIEVGPASTGIAVKSGSGGKLFIAVDSPPQLISLDAELKFISTQELKNLGVGSVSDFCITGSFTLIIIDPMVSLLFRTDTRLRQLNSLQLETDRIIFQPISVTSSPEGELYIANYSDHEIWKMDRNGTLSRHSKMNGTIRLNNKKIEYIPAMKYISFIDNGHIKFLNSYGNIVRSRTVETFIKNPADFVIINSEIWIGGESLECVSATSSKVLYSFPKDSLYAIGISPISAIAAAGDSLLYMLSYRGDKLAKAVIIRENSE